MIPILVFLSCLGVTCLSYWLLTRRANAKRRLLWQRLTEASLPSIEKESLEFRAERNELLSEMPRFDGWLQRVRLATRIRQMIEQADVRMTVMRLSMLSVLAGMIASLTVSLFVDSILVEAIVGLAVATIPFLYVLWKRARRMHAFLADLPAALDLMSRGLLAGHAFTESLMIVANEMAEPIAGEFRKAYEEQRLGLSYKLALRNLTTRIPLLDLRLCVTAILIQRETGGNLSELLANVSHTIRERFKIIEDLKTLTTSSRISAWVLCALPLLVAAGVAFLNPEYLDPLWRDPRGIRLVYIAIGMQITGMLIVRQIMRIRI